MAEYHVTQDGSGAETGASFANAIAVDDMDFASLNAGDEVTLYGEITSAIEIKSSGSNGSPITVKGEDAVLGYWTDWAALRTWTDEGNNIWSTPFTDSANNPLINFGAVGEYGERIDYIGASKAIAKAKDWDIDTSEQKLFIYSVGAPVSYYGQVLVSDRAAIVIKDERFITLEELGFRYAALCVHALVRSYATADMDGVKILGGWFENVGNGFRIGSDSATYTMKRCEINGVVGTTYGEKHSHIHGRVGEGNYIRNNRAVNGGLSISTAAFYIGEGENFATGKSYIDDNYVDGYTYGKFWPSDGAGCFLDNWARNIKVNRNFVKNTEGPAYKSNSGEAGNKFNSNIGIGGTYGFLHRDSRTVNNATTKLHNNTLIGATEHAVRINNLTGTIDVRNNILGSVGDGISFAENPTVNESHNVFFGTARQVKQDGQAATSGTSGVNADPLFVNPNGTTAEDFKLRPDSPAFGAGTCVYTTGCVPYDYRGWRARVPPDIGAFQRNLQE